MGIPYSKQINAAFDQGMSPAPKFGPQVTHPFTVSPLVAEGFEVLQTTRNITLMLAEIQVLTLLMLFLILVAMVMLLITCNPDLVGERRALVTPALQWTASWVVSGEGKRKFGITGALAMLGVLSVGYAHYYAYIKKGRTAVDKTTEDQQGRQSEN